MHMVSLNAWCGGMLTPLIEWLPICESDVLCVQKVTWTPGSTAGSPTSIRTARYDSVPASSKTYDGPCRSIRRTFPHATPGPCCVRTVPCAANTSAFATLVAPRVAVIGTEATFVHGSSAHHDAWPPEDRGRVVHAVRVDGGDAGIVTVAHLHGVRMASGKGDTPERLSQAEEVVALVGRVRGPDDLVAVTGDLNLLPDSQSFDIFGAAGLVDLVGTIAFGPRPTRKHCGTPTTSSSQTRTWSPRSRCWSNPRSPITGLWSLTCGHHHQ